MVFFLGCTTKRGTLLDQIHLSFQLFILGYGCSSILEFIRGLILRIEEYPRIERTWRFYPPFLGAILINFFPSIVPSEDLLVLWAHGAISPAFAYGSYPLLKKAFVKRTEALSLLTNQSKEDTPIVHNDSSGAKKE